MRPVHLSVAGLHSFREQQEVDFLTLCEGGVFGIFGPTGSGKSSLLDAITLALYGTVERANNNTQGIMNHAEDQIQVSFTFELGNAHGSTRYRVERSFKRTSDVNVRTATCRFLELTDETIVLADKNNDVNQKVQELLGLTIDDFTRAVVLPQGKFAEFLSLKGSDRRQMLQRLFHLEQYGDLLNEKLRLKIGALKGKLSETVAEQQGLGDASEEAMVQAKAKVSKSNSLLKNVEQQRKQIEQEYESQRNIWQWQEELHKVELELFKLKEQREAITELEQRLQGAEEALQMKRYIEEWEQAQAEHQQCVVKQGQALQEFKAAKKQEDQHAQAYQESVRVREVQQPYWIERQAQLKQAQVVQNELSKLEQDILSLGQTIESKQKAETEQRTSLERMKGILGKATTKQKELKQELDRLFVSVDERERLRSANTDQATIINLEQQLRVLMVEFQKKEAEQFKLESTQVHGQEQNQSYYNQARALLESITHTFTDSNHIELRLKNRLSLIQQWQEDQERLTERQKEQNFAIQLAKQLRSGEACPVCGSMEHPKPVTITHDQDKNEWKYSAEHLEEVKLWVVKAREQQYIIQNNAKRLEQLFQDTCDIFFDIEEIKTVSLQHQKTMSQIATTVEKSGKNNDQKDGQNDGHIGDGSLHIEEINQLLKDCKMLEPTIVSIQEDSRRMARLYGEESKKQAEIVVMLHSVKAENLERQKKLNLQQKEIEEKKVRWKQSYPQYSYENIAEEQQKMDQSDRESTSIKQRIDQSVEFIDEKKKEIDQAQEKLRQLHLQQAESTSIYNQKKELVELKINQLTEQIGSEQIEGLLQDAASKLTEIKVQEQQASQRWQSSREQLQGKEKVEGIASESLKQAHKRLNKTTEQWQGILAESSFTTIDQAKDSVAEKEIQAQWKKEIEHYLNQDKKWAQEHDRLQSLLGDRKISSDQWQESVQQREQIGQKWDEALRESGASKQALQELETKHQRYLELEETRQESAEGLEMLGKLQSVFRGNSFVEYVAEEQLMQICREASQRLGALTRQRYALEVDSSGGFIIRDDANGGVKRPVTTLSGGETFLTSLALALSLSAQIQLRGEYPLEFFFLDEGFGTLDQDLLDTVITALEQLHTDRLSVGVISHVPELRSRLPRRLVVEPAEASGRGSRIFLETL
jgi:exonuclease SbcC